MGYEESLQREFDQNAQTIADISLALSMSAPTDGATGFNPFVYALDASRLFFRNLHLAEIMANLAERRS